MNEIASGEGVSLTWPCLKELFRIELLFPMNIFKNSKKFDVIWLIFITGDVIISK